MRRYETHYSNGTWRIWDRALDAFCGLDGTELQFTDGTHAEGWLIRCAADGLPGAVDHTWRVLPGPSRWVATRSTWKPRAVTVVADTPEGLAVAMERLKPRRPEPHSS